MTTSHFLVSDNKKKTPEDAGPMTTASISPVLGGVSISHATHRTTPRNVTQAPPQFRDTPHPISVPPLSTLIGSCQISYFWVTIFSISQLTQTDAGQSPLSIWFPKAEKNKWESHRKINNMGAKEQTMLKEIHHFVAELHLSRTAEAILKHVT